MDTDYFNKSYGSEDSGDIEIQAPLLDKNSEGSSQVPYPREDYF